MTNVAVTLRRIGRPTPALLLLVLLAATLCASFVTSRIPIQVIAAGTQSDCSPVVSLQKQKPAVKTNRSHPALQHLASRPLAFEQNLGQTNKEVEFFARGAGFNLFLTKSEAVLALNSRSAKERRPPVALRMTLEGSTDEPRVSGEDQLPGSSNYFIGKDPANWRTDVPSYAKLRYRGVYKGVDLVYYGRDRQLEFDFQLAPFADPRSIRLRFSGAKRVRINARGDLILASGSGLVRQKKPIVYQEIDGQRRFIDGRYTLLGGTEVGFIVAAYDRSRALVIDPVLVYSTYLGGSGNDFGNSVAVDSSGNVYVTGETNSLNFPTRDPYQGSGAGNSDVFVTKFNATGSAQIYSTYLGGSGLDRGDGIAVDSNGNAYVVGRVDSASVNFPTTTGSFQPNYRGGDFDGFVTKLNSLGNALVYSTYLGGIDNDSAIGVAVDATFNAYITGGTKSIDFPVSINAYQTNLGGDTDAYLTKLNPAGSAILYSTYVGGISTDRGSSVAVDSAGNAFLAGFTRSTDFPIVNAFQSTNGGTFDAFILKLNSSGTDATFSTYLGGSGDDRAFGIALDSSNNCYVTGQTSSNNFPVANALFSNFGGSFDGFVTKIDSNGTKIFATYLGGSGDDRATAVAVGANQPYITGFTSSTNFPTANPLQGTNAGGTDAFVTKLNATGTALLYSTYLGGAANDNFNNQNITYSGGIATDSSGNTYLTGFTFSTNFPMVTPFQSAIAGGSDAFVLKINDGGSSGDFAVSVSPPTRIVIPGAATSYDVTITPSGGFTGLVNLSIDGLPLNASASFNPAAVNITGSSSVSSTLAVTTAATTPLGESQLTITGSSGTTQRTGLTRVVVVSPTNADLALAQTASPNPAVVGMLLSYRIVVTNNGPGPATGVTATDQLPAGVTFVLATPTQGVCSGTTTVTCNLGTIAVNASPSVAIVVTPTQPGQLSNSASVAANESDPLAGNNSQTVITNVQSQNSVPTILDPNLTVGTVCSGLNQPISMAFLGQDDLLVLEKTTGKVQRIVNGTLQSTVLDLAVDGASERGLLGIALHPNFAINGFVYLYWTESSTGIDTTNVDEVPLLGNRIDRYIWNGSALTFDRNLIKLRALQQDANQPSRGNHNGGVLRFGPDGKLYLIMGDNGRRGFLQNVTSGGPVPDDQFGGPEPDNAHLTGIILRLNDDGSTPTDNPFFSVNSGLTGEAAANIKKIFAYGVRNGFGMAFDPLTGNLWTQENGDDSFDEMNRVVPGFNGGWVQIMGPLNRIDQYKSIEVNYASGDLQQLRWPPSNIADTPQAALARLYMLPGARYTDPEFSWKYAVAPAGIAFVRGRGLGPQFEGDMFVGASRTALVNGYLFRFKFTGDRQHFSFTDPRLSDLVADNTDKFDLTESESLLIGRDFGVTSDIETGPNGNVFVVSLSNGAIYEIKSKPSQIFVATLNASQEVPPTNSTATGTATLILSPDETTARVSLSFAGLQTQQTAAHIHGPAPPGTSAPVLFPLPLGQFTDFQINLTTSQAQDLKNGLFYINLHSTAFANGEIRGQFQTSSSLSTVQLGATSFSVSEAESFVVVNVSRLGNASAAASVNYSTSDTAGLAGCNVISGKASERCDYGTTVGTLRFAAGETTKSFIIPLINDSLIEGNETFTITLSGATGTALGSPSTATVTILDNDTVPATLNPIDEPRFFITQQYIDFLGRLPDQTGLANWLSTLNGCPNGGFGENQNPDCDRVHISAGFFLSNEFRIRGYWAYRFYEVGFDRRPTYAEFVPDMSLVGGPQSPDSEALSKAAYTDAFVLRTEFKNRYDSLSNSAYVNALEQNAEVILTNKAALIAALDAGTKTRAQVLREIVESQAVDDHFFIKAFVAMQYFGYLRRDPDPTGYNNWVTTLTADPSNYRHMIFGFIYSTEYRSRFGP